jgi:ERCC4-type nuclease
MADIEQKFSELLITCDTREQSALIQNKKVPTAIIKGKLISEYSNDEIIKLTKQRPRIWQVANYCMKKGAEVVIDNLDRCDYKIEGIYQGKVVCLGVEYKTLNDIAGSIDDLTWKLPEAYAQFGDVALFVEGRLNIVPVGQFYYVRNFEKRDASVLRFDKLTGYLETWRQLGIHVRQFEREDMFPIVLEDLLNYITKDVHTTFSTKTQCNEDIVIKMLCQVPGLGVKTISKMLRKRKFTVFEFINMNIEELQSIAGKDKGIKIYNAIHSIEWK